MFFSLLASYGLAILLVEFSGKWPVKYICINLKKFVHDWIHWRAAQVFYCTVCLSFWTTLIVEIFLFIFIGYFMWPISGFATAGFTWTLIQFMNVLDRG